MIDSGSDMGSLNYDIIEELRLPLKGYAKQEVPGGEKLKKFYNAYLVIGGKTLNIEVRS